MTDTTTRPIPALVLCELADATTAAGIESYSPFCTKVHRALRAAGLSYTRRHAGAPADHKELDPVGQVPILLIGDEAVGDSTRIVQRIDAMLPAERRFDGGSDPRDRAEVTLLEELADTALNGFLVASRWADEDNWTRTREAYFGGIPAPAPVREKIASEARERVIHALFARDVWRRGATHCWSRFATMLDSLDARVPTRGYLASPGLSVADLAVFGQVQSFRTPLTPAQRTEVEARPRLRAYLDRLDEETRGNSARQERTTPTGQVMPVPPSPQ